MPWKSSFEDYMVICQDSSIHVSTTNVHITVASMIYHICEYCINIISKLQFSTDLLYFTYDGVLCVNPMYVHVYVQLYFTVLCMYVHVYVHLTIFYM